MAAESRVRTASAADTRIGCDFSFISALCGRYCRPHSVNTLIVVSNGKLLRQARGGKQQAEPGAAYLLEKLRRAADEKAVLMALKYSYRHPTIFEGMSPRAIAELYRSKEEFISKTEENVDAIVKLRTTAATHEAMTGRGI